MELHVILKHHYLIIISQVFILTLKAFLWAFFLPKSKPILVGVSYQPPDKSGFIEYLNNALRENNISNIQECYLILTLILIC